MSGSNPYAVNGNGNGRPRQSSDSNSNPNSNPYAPTNAANTVSGGRYADPYLNQQNNASSASINSFGSRERRRRSNPYDQRDRDRDSPAPPSSIRSGSGAGGGYPASGPATGGGGGGGGYGGLPRPRYAEGNPPPPPPQNDYNEPASGRTRTPLGTEYEQRPLRPPTRDRERTYNNETRDRTYNNDTRERSYNSDARDRNGAGTPGTMPPPPSLPPKSSMSSLNQQSAANGYGSQNLPPPPPQNIVRHYSPRRPAKSMEEILHHIQSNWKDMEGDECVPVKMALRLMDPSSLGLADKESDFADTHVDLQKSLKTVVNEHYADFNSAVGTYHKIQNAIKESQTRVRLLKGGLMNVRGGMLTTRPELRGLAEESRQLDEMLVTLANIESLKSIPGKLEERISEKKFLGAVDLLMESLKSVTKSDLDGIGAISDLRSYFVNQQSTLVDILVEELHDHLYLRSPYCRDRWKGTKANGEERDPKDNLMGGGVNVWDRPFNNYLNSVDVASPMIEDASKNPEADTFYYIHMILESLNKLGQLGEAVSRIEQRMPVELFKVVERTNTEIDAKYPSHVRSRLGRESRLSVLLHLHDGRSQVLSEFLYTLYSKFEAIAESHRVLHEIVAGIVTREKWAKPEKYTGGFKELWKLYQMEMRSLLHDYLATDGDMVIRSGLSTTSSSDVFARPPRDKNKKMFKLSEMDQKSAAMKAEEEELDEILKSSVPGLVSKSRAVNGADVALERGGQDSSAAGHKLLIEPGVFNMPVLLPPSLTFLQRLKDVVPPTSHIPMSTLTSFLDDFLINVFHPQLEEAVTELCTRCMIDLEAFSEEADWAKLSPRPIFKGTVSFMALIRAFSAMLGSIPQDQMFTQLIINQLVTYYDKCYGYYKAIVSRVAPSETNPNVNTLFLKAAATLAQAGEVHDAALELLRFDRSRREGGVARSVLIAREVQTLLAATRANPLSSYDIISDPKSVHQLSLLYNSMQWLSAALAKIRQVEPSSHSGLSHARSGSQPQNARRWTLITGLRSASKTTSAAGATANPVFLPLTSETAIAFDQTVSSFRTLAQTSLLTLHIDVRCGVIHQLTRTLSGPGGGGGVANSNKPTSPVDNRDSSGPLPPLDSGLYPYVLSGPPSSASPLILELNNDLIAFDSNIAAYLGQKERDFILSGLARLVDRYLVISSDKIGVMNENGAEKFRIDAMVVQQNLRAILASTSPGHGSHGGNEAEKDSDSDRDRAKPADPTATGLGISTEPSSSPPEREEDDDEEEDSGLLVSSSQYIDLFLSGPDAILQHVQDYKSHKKEIGFSYDELRTLVELWFSAKLRGDDREEAIRARKNLQDVLLALGEGMWDS